jgi:hypothetical protein
MGSNMSVNDYFTIQYGQKEYESKSHLNKGNIALVSSAGVNNGVYGFFDIEPKFENVLSFPRTGSIGEARVHDYPCCIDNNCLVLVPKKPLTRSQLYYAASVLGTTKWRFKYGRQATEERIKDVALPLMAKIDAEWTVPNIDVGKAKLDVAQALGDLDGKRLSDLFDIKKGEGCYFEKCKTGKTPLISASEMDNGVIGFVDLPPAFRAPCLTIERVGAKVHIQTMDFVTVPDDIFVLIPKRSFTVDALFLIGAILNVNRWRFSYSRKVTKSRLEKIGFRVDAKNKLLQVVLVESEQKQLASFPT